MADAPQGWTFTDGPAVDWSPMGDSVAMKMLGGAAGRVIALFRFEPGYEGGVHDHGDAEFTYLLEGDLVSNRVHMQAGHAYAARAGTQHSELRTGNGATLVSVFQYPG